jgi:glycerol-1-phosphate dehydrogenase [NAD(P)+]
MPLLARTVATPLVVEIGHGSVAQVPALLRDRRISPGGQVAYLLGPGRGEAVGEQLDIDPQDKRAFLVESASVSDAEQLAGRVRAQSFDAVVGIGGGRTLDVAKWVGTRLGVPTVAVATSLAHDGVTSPVSVLEYMGRKGSYGVQIPLAVVVDTEFVREGDPRTTRAGIGDLLSNLSAVADWELAAVRRGEPKDGLAITMARTAAHSVLYSTESIDSESFLCGLAESLVLSGLAMAVAGTSRPCSGACHEISHALDELNPDRGTLHGEQVAVGALYATFLRQDEHLFEQLRAAFARFGLGPSPVDLGIEESAFVQAVAFAPSTRPERFTVLEDLDQNHPAVEATVRAFMERCTDR